MRFLIGIVIGVILAYFWRQRGQDEDDLFAGFDDFQAPGAGSAQDMAQQAAEAAQPLLHQAGAVADAARGQVQDARGGGGAGMAQGAMDTARQVGERVASAAKEAAAGAADTAKQAAEQGGGGQQAGGESGGGKSASDTGQASGDRPGGGEQGSGGRGAGAPGGSQSQGSRQDQPKQDGGQSGSGPQQPSGGQSGGRGQSEAAEQPSAQRGGRAATAEIDAPDDGRGAQDLAVKTDTRRGGEAGGNGGAQADVRQRFAWLRDFGSGDIPRAAILEGGSELEGWEQYVDISQPGQELIRPNAFGKQVPRGRVYVAKSRVPEDVWYRLVRLESQ